MRHVLAPLPAAVLGVLLVTGCTGGSPASTPAASPGGSPSEASTSSAPAVPAAPPSGACYRLRSRELTRPASSSRPVPCGGVHTSVTIHVGRLDTRVSGRSVAADSDVVTERLAAGCRRQLAAYVGGSRTARDLSRLNVVWFSPTPEQTGLGAAWSRCDLIAFDRADALLALPPARRLRGVLGRPGALDTYGLCGTAAPGARGFERVICGRRHAWRAIDTVPLPGGSRYPGAARVRRAGDARCKAAARARAANTLRFRYGWEFPSAEQWTVGQHFGYCWVPS
jgi:Septum formation